MLARDTMARTRVWKLLQGYRDRPAADLDGLALTLVKISQLVTDLSEVQELDINPLLAGPEGGAGRSTPGSACAGRRTPRCRASPSAPTPGSSRSG